MTTEVWTVLVQADECMVKGFDSEESARQWVVGDMDNVMKDSGDDREYEYFKTLDAQGQEDYFLDVLNVSYMVERQIIKSKPKICT